MARHPPTWQTGRPAVHQVGQRQTWTSQVSAGNRLQLYGVLLGLFLVVSGCTSGTTRKNALIKSSKNVQTTAAELSSRNHSLLGLYSAEIENAADKIIQASPSPVTRRQALVWKADAIPVLQTALLRTDPVAATLDAWAFILQMQAYMEQPEVKQGWGESYPVVTETLNRMESEMEQLIRAAAPSADIDDARQNVGVWATAHPVEVSLSGRKTADADLIRRTKQSDLGAAASIKALGESLGDLTARLDAYNAYEPKQARWQAELLLIDLARDPQVNSAMSNFAALSSTLEKTSGNVERMPEYIEQARKAILADVDNQRLAVQEFLRQERLQTMQALDQARIATLGDMQRQRLAAMADLRGERQIVLDDFHQEAEALMKDLNAASAKTLTDFDSRTRGLIDHFFVRALELGLLLTLLCVLAVWLLVRHYTPRRRDRGEALYDRAA
jgi:hypothetical protein